MKVMTAVIVLTDAEYETMIQHSKDMWTSPEARMGNVLMADLATKYEFGNEQMNRVRTSLASMRDLP